MISVVIPYFQRQPGVLRKALASIAAQQGCGAVSVLVVDDASPVPAADEVVAVPVPEWLSVRVITQANAGPGAARNTGLDAIAPGTRYVAFLDSDDEWSTDHLARAVAALDQGFDFYFADHFQLGQSVGAFARGGRIAPAEHPPLPLAEPALHAYKGDMFDQILRGNVVGTSTVVFRFEPFASERFRVDLTSAGEDYLFWMALAHRGARVAFSARIEATYGRGVNVYAGSGWGTETHLMRVHHEIRYRLAIRQAFALSPTQAKHVSTDVRRLRVTFLRDVLHRLRHGKRFPAGLLAQHFRTDPATFLASPLYVVQALRGR